jgi:adenylate kinase family enzyme
MSTGRKIHIVGGSGVGKTTLATRLGAMLGVPVYHLDDVARVGGGTGPPRTEAERAALLQAIISKPAWITEGVHLGWTEPLLRESDLIVWMAGIPPRTARIRILQRFIRDAWAEAKRRQGRERLLRFRDYGTQIRALLHHLSTFSSGASGTDRQPDEIRHDRAAHDALRPYVNRVRRLETDAQIESFVRQLADEGAGAADG